MVSIDQLLSLEWSIWNQILPNLPREFCDEDLKHIPKHGCTHAQTPNEEVQFKLGSICRRINLCADGTCCDTCEGEEFKCSYDPVDGQWSAFGRWSSCKGKCDDLGTQFRSRSCSNPAPKHGGQYCEGSPVEKVLCSMPCCPCDKQLVA